VTKGEKAKIEYSERRARGESCNIARSTKASLRLACERGGIEMGDVNGGAQKGREKKRPSEEQD